MSAVLLVVDAISKILRGRQVLQDVSFDAARGSITGVAGPNGSGKTTLLSCINGRYPIDSGSITLEGTVVDRAAAFRRTRCGISTAFQVPRLFGKMTVAENLAVARAASNRSADPEFLDSLIHSLEIHNLMTSSAVELSYGQRKVVEVARVLVQRPKLALLDEPFAGVSDSRAALLSNVIIERSRDLGTAFIVVAHEMPRLMQLAEDIVFLEEGRVAFRGDVGGFTAYCLSARERHWMPLPL